ncbi:hypothetical protein Tsubulata_041536 [Turnera subulata]|uniref:SAWADEE domain-containing protein n=1 Tax=Turnera subulata TaxID=218843 RepID=A0A9Q0J8K6_9ROSI|nr:hypothetical protein Tsubulata_041536 [Turnera subulata]
MVDMEYQHPDDNAWYDVGLAFDGETLRLSYAGFPEEQDETFPVGKLETAEELEAFRGRFRRSSVQLQDHECSKIVHGKAVCASYQFENGEVKFYDALVVEVLNEEHECSGAGEEICSCTYVLKWQEGSLQGKRTFARIGDVCFTPPGKEIDPPLEDFLRMSRDRVKGDGGVLVGGEEPRNTTTTIYKDGSSYFKRMLPPNVEPRRRKFLCACKTNEGRIHGHCKK